MNLLFDCPNGAAGPFSHFLKATAFDFHQPQNLPLARGQLSNQLFEIANKFRGWGQNSFVQLDFTATRPLAVTLGPHMPGDGVNPGQRRLAWPPCVAAAVHLVPGFLQEFFHLVCWIALPEDHSQPRRNCHDQLFQCSPFPALIAAHPVLESNFRPGVAQMIQCMVSPLLLTLFLAQSQDLSLSLGVARAADANAGHFFGANYALGLHSGQASALFAQFDFVAVPNQVVRLANPSGSRDYASLYAMPGLRLSFRPSQKVSPFVGGGAGLAVFEQSALLQNGQPFPGSRTSSHFGGFLSGGVDLAIYRWSGLRLELKDYIAVRHNFTARIALHFRWGKPE